MVHRHVAALIWALYFSFLWSINAAAQTAYHQRLTEACGDLDPDSLDYSHCEDEFSRSESNSQDRDELRDEDDYERLEAQQAHEDALEQMAP